MVTNFSMWLVQVVDNNINKQQNFTHYLNNTNRLDILNKSPSSGISKNDTTSPTKGLGKTFATC